MTHLHSDHTGEIDALPPSSAPRLSINLAETMEALADIQRRAEHVLPMHDLHVFTDYPERGAVTRPMPAIDLIELSWT